MSKVLSQLTTIEGMTLDCHLHFRVTREEFLQTYEGIRNDVSTRRVDTLSLGPNRNMQGGIRCCSLGTESVLQQKWRDVEVMTVPLSAISRVNCTCKKEKVLKGLQFSCRNNDITCDSISTGAHDPDVEELIHSPTQSEILMREPNAEAISADTYSNENTEEVMVEKLTKVQTE